MHYGYFAVLDLCLKPALQLLSAEKGPAKSPGTAERSSGLQQYSGVGTELSRTYEGEELSSA